MSSHQEWQEKVIAEHDALKPFAPENGSPLKFKAGDSVTFTNDYGVKFAMTVTGIYCPDFPCSLYARGFRYTVNSDSPWFPIRECDLKPRS